MAALLRHIQHHNASRRTPAHPRRLPQPARTMVRALTHCPRAGSTDCPQTLGPQHPVVVETQTTSRHRAKPQLDHGFKTALRFR